jgi:cbb3-type cytochrome oxidase subunit 3
MIPLDDILRIFATVGFIGVFLLAAWIIYWRRTK